MRARVEKCFGGYAGVIPEPQAGVAALREGDLAAQVLTDGRLILRVGGPGSLRELLAGVTVDNRHEEWAAGSPAGDELL